MAGVRKARLTAGDKETASGRVELRHADRLKRRKVADKAEDGDKRPSPRRGPGIDVDVVIDPSSPVLDDLVSLLGKVITAEYFEKKKDSTS